MLRPESLLKSRAVHMFAPTRWNRKSHYDTVNIGTKICNRDEVPRTTSHRSLLFQQAELDWPARGSATRCRTRRCHPIRTDQTWRIESPSPQWRCRRANKRASRWPAVVIILNAIIYNTTRTARKAALRLPH